MNADEWINRAGPAWADEWRRTDRSFAGLDAALEAAILAAMPATGRLVDIGCGAGTTSFAIAKALPGAELVGLDLSPALIAAATHRSAGKRGAGTAHCRFVDGDATATVGDFAPVAGFFSRHGVMFFDDPALAFKRFAAAAVSGAPLVFSCFAAAADNGWAGQTAAAAGAAPPPPGDGPPPPGPFAFADRGRVRSILTAAGWSAPEPQRVDFRYVAGAGDDPVADALAFFTRIGPAASALAAAPVAERPARLERLAEVCARHREGNEIVFDAAAWLWSAELRGNSR